MKENRQAVVTLRLPCDAQAPARVRAALAEQRELGWIIGDVMLVASELVTNAVLHSFGSVSHELHFTAEVGEDRVRICVEDPGVPAGVVTPLQISEFSDAGVGLLIVDHLADRWGAARDGGYRVWAEFDVAGA